MDNEKDYNENYGLHVDDGKQYEASDLELDNRPSHVTLGKKEAVEGDDNEQLSRQEKEPEDLESVHKYANRIKSFLGWVLNEEEQVDEKESEHSTSGDADGNTTTENEHKSPKSIAKDYESLEKDENIARFQENEQVNDIKPGSLLESDYMNDCHIIDNTSCESEISKTENKAMNPEVEDANLRSTSLSKLSADIKATIDETVTSNGKSESDMDRADNTTSEIEQFTHSSVENSTSVGTVHENPGKEVKTLDNDPKKVSITDDKDNVERTPCDSEMGFSNENEISDTNNLNSDLKQITCTTNAEKTEAEQNGNCTENLCEDIENEDILNLNENVLLISNIKKPYMDEIRRLSIDIVKDVIESASNSVHEMFSEQRTAEKYANHDVKGTTNVVNGSKIGNAEDEHNINHKLIEDEFTLQKVHSTESMHDMNTPKDLLNDEECAIDEETICGFGSFRPKWIQKYATPRIFLLFFSIVGIINGTYYSYFVSNISTLEKRFAFKTKVSGTLLLAEELTPLILGVIVGYVGGKTHRPRMVTLGMFGAAVCCFVSGMPYFFYGPEKHITVHNVKNITGPELCFSDVIVQSCDSDDRPPTMTVVGIIVFANFLKGFSSLSYHVIGISFMDDNSKKKNSPLYLAVALALRLLGPLVGFLMSSAFLKIYENPFDDPGYGPDDPRWIGAWWMGFFLQGILLVIFTLPIALFPRRLPSQKKVEKHASDNNKENVRETLRGLIAALKRLGKNPIFILMICNTTMKIFGHFGHSIMLPKYMENQFRLSAADASLFSGATSIFCVMISTVLGGFLIWKYRPRIKMLLAGMVASEIILCLGFLILMIPRCEPNEMVNFGVNDDGLILDSVCNQNCDCSTTSFTPFCGSDGKTTYFSPCYAGCTQEITTDMLTKKQTVFGNCSCVNVSNSPEGNSATITEGFCPDDSCWSKALTYLIILLIMLTISNTFTVAHTMILLRSVHPADKSIALGTFETFICLFGFIPFPVSFGALVDSACLVWEQSCGETGNCWFYDMEKFGYLLHGASAVFCCFSTVCLITLYCLSNRVRDLYVEEDEVEHIDNIKLDTVSGSVTKL